MGLLLKTKTVTNGYMATEAEEKEHIRRAIRAGQSSYYYYFIGVAFEGKLFQGKWVYCY